jgi:hypothetical protein
VPISKEDARGLYKKKDGYYIFDHFHNGRRIRPSTGEKYLRNAVVVKYRILEEENNNTNNNRRHNIGGNNDDNNNSIDINNNDNIIDPAQKEHTFDDVALKFIEEKERGCKPSV